MNKISFKEGMQQQFDDIKLSDDQLAKLMDLQDSKNISERNFSSIRRLIPSSKIFAGLAASVVIAISLIFYISNQPVNIGERIAYEVSKNHLKLKPLEINSDKLGDLGRYLSQLDFKLVNIQILSDTNWQLLGARYCSIQGNTAAQLRIKHKQTGTIETLYQAPYNADQFSSIPAIENNQYPLEEFSKGMGVKIWVEKGVLFALTNNNTQD